MITQTRAVVLRSMKYNDTSKIVRMFTEECGKVAVIAKGARSARSPFGSSLEVMGVVDAVFYRKEDRELHFLSRCETVLPLPGIVTDMGRLQSALSIVELTDAVTPPEEPARHMFTALLETLQVVNSATNNHLVALYSFESRVLHLLGFKPEMMHCTRCGRIAAEDGSGRVALSPEGVLCEQCGRSVAGAPSVRSMTRKALHLLQQEMPEPLVRGAGWDPPVLREVGRTLDWYLRLHVHGFRGLKSDAVFAAIQ